MNPILATAGVLVSLLVATCLLEVDLGKAALAVAAAVACILLERT